MARRFSLILACLAAVGCGGSSLSPDAAVVGDAPPPGDAPPALTTDAPAVATLWHYAPCDSTAECPAGDTCNFLWPNADEPVPSPPPVSYCQPRCSTDAECTSDAYGDPAITGFCEAGSCYLYCAIGGLVPTCQGDWVCSYWRPSSPRDGYCILPE